jgi:putative phosphotransacetylase
MSLNRIPPQASNRIMAKDDGVLVSPGDGTVNRSEIERIVRQIVLARIGTAGGPEPPALRVDASARHLHLSQEDLETLFGPGYELKVHRPLYQEGNFAAQETVTIIGPRSRLISNLRILGPLRKKTQVELAFTDAISLGFDNLPIRLSGDTAGTPGALLMGPRGVLEIKEGVIRAAIHVHMNPREAAYFGVRQGDLMKLRVGGAAGATFDRVHVRIDPTSRLNVHMDTDEANACGLHLAKDIELVK